MNGTSSTDSDAERSKKNPRDRSAFITILVGLLVAVFFVWIGLAARRDMANIPALMTAEEIVAAVKQCERIGLATKFDDDGYGSPVKSWCASSQP